MELTDEAVSMFKIGITGNPFTRWSYYEAESRNSAKGVWDRLILLAMNKEPGLIEMLEASLIKKFKGDCRCANIKPGGEGTMRGGPPFYTYIVIGRRQSVAGRVSA